MITKDERTSRNPFEQDLAQAQEVRDRYAQEEEGESHRPLSIGDSPPTYDDPNYIPSPSSVSRSNTTMLPLVVPQGTDASGTWSDPGSSVVTTTTGTSTNTTSVAPLYLMSPEVSTEWTRTLHDLERNMSSLQAARTRAAQPKQSDAEKTETVREVRALEEMVLGNMRRLALIHPHPDPRVQAEWHARAEAFVRTMSTFRTPEAEEPEAYYSNSRALVERDTQSYREESYTDPGRADNDDFIIDRQPSRRRGLGLGEGGSSSFVPSSFGMATSSLGTKAKRILAKTESDKGLAYIKKGTAGVFLAPIAISGALLYGTAALFYGAGKGAVHLGKKAAGAAQTVTSSRAGMPPMPMSMPTDPAAAAAATGFRSASDPELVTRSKSTYKGGYGHDAGQSREF